MHHVAAVGDAAKVAEFAADNDRGSGKNDVYRAAARAEILTIAAPAGPGHDWFGADSIAHGAAHAAAGIFPAGFAAHTLIAFPSVRQLRCAPICAWCVSILIVSIGQQ